MNPYHELGLPTNATFEEIKQKYKQLAQYHHPDKGGDEEMFKRVKLAYEILCDPIRRQRYDKTGNINATLSIKSEALDQLSQMMFRLLPNINADFDDLVLKMKVEVSLMKQDLIINNNNCKNIISNLKRVHERVKLKYEGENILQGFITTQIEGRQNEIKEYERRILVVELMSEILENYHYGLKEWLPILESPSL